MGAEVNVQSSGSAQQHELDHAMDGIGVTAAHKKIIFLIMLGVMFDVFEQNAVGLVGPILRQQWGISVSQIGFLNTLTFSAAALGRVASGYIADRYGRRVMLNVNLLLFTLGAVICALAPNYAVLSSGRFIVGIGLGGEISVAVTMLAELCSTRFRGTAVGLVSVGSGGFGNMLAPAFGLAVFAMFPGPDSWRWLFGCLVAPAIFVVFYRRLIPETPRYLLSKGRVDEVNRVLSGLASGRLGKLEGEPTQYIKEAIQNNTPRARVRLRDVFQGRLRRRTIALGVAVSMTYGAQISVLTLMPTILISQGYTISKSLLFTMVMQSGSLFGALAASFCGYHFPRKRVLTLGAVLACAAGLCFGFLTFNVALVLLFGACFTFCVVLLNTSIWIFAPEQYPTDVRAFGTSLILALGTLAGALTPIVSGRVFEIYGVGGMFSMLAAMYAIFALSVQFAPETFGRPMGDIGEPDAEDEPELAVNAGSASRS
ncbi:4-hydroxybenzoate transporter PcaK [Paraburkholderia caffeinitolerans]|uniref:4-hydroxybenzoate transporter PcaK n=1 Tax=Paraburkholderia caffeinitolerans TaxID=1723730 RepID=A0A6J5FGD8_9BURK|nr:MULTISPECIES: MFS transporter [Paraburkholderia]CAB3777823.1 4-hydroxybenzoate transporter PcaK [Paraburkholderia caffeinitolerans]